MANTIIFRVSNKGVPHVLITHRGYTFSICYFGKSNLYRIFLYGTGYDNNHKLLDIEMQKGDSFNIETTLDGLIESMELQRDLS